MQTKVSGVGETRMNLRVEESWKKVKVNSERGMRVVEEWGR